MIEHNLEAIKTADWIIDLGTGRFLTPVLGRREAKRKKRIEAAE